MTNLIENGAKYSFENTEIKIDLSVKGDYVSINVTDEGCKIAEKDYENVFRKFSRLDNPLTREVQGNGLGLFITKNLVEKMNGKISVNSSDNKTTFEVLFKIYNLELGGSKKWVR